MSRTNGLLVLLTACILVASPMTEVAQSSERLSWSPSNPGVKVRQISKIIPCTRGMEFNQYASDSLTYSYMCWNNYDSQTIVIDIFNKDPYDQSDFRKEVLNEWCFNDQDFALFTDFKNYAWSGSYRNDKKMRFLLTKFKKLYRNSVAYTLSPSGWCKKIK